MTTRYTVKDVRNRFEALAKTANNMGVDVSGWQLHEGSGTNGVAYRLFDKGRAVLNLSNGFLGMTATEATRTLQTMINVLYWIQDNTEILARQAFREGYQDAVTAYIRTGNIPPRPESGS